MKKIILVIFAAGFILTACAAFQSGTTIAGTWDVVSYGSASSPTPSLPDLDRSIIFGGDGKISGNVGCNSFRGNYSVEGGKITFQPMVSTKLACTPDVVMKQEQAILQILSGSADYKIDNRYLTITNHDQTLVMKVGGN